LILDALLPEMTGWELASRLHACYETPVPVLFVTALSMEQVQQHMTAGPGIGVVLKPFDLAELFSMIESLIGPIAAANEAAERRSLVSAGFG
jgi:CheY-like chemotaxis protein